MDIIKALKWRYATQKFDTDKKVSDENFDMLMEAVRLSPSSWGLQPWKLVVVKDKELRKRLAEEASGQPKVAEASHLVVLCRLESVNVDYIENYVELVAKIQNVTVESLEEFKKARVDSISKKTPAEQAIYMSNQVYLALGVLLTTAAAMGIDACPMGGFSPKKCDEILGLDKLGLKSQVLCAIGYRAKNDPAATRKKVRFPKENLVIEI